MFSRCFYAGFVVMLSAACNNLIAGSITLINNSVFNLTANIYNAQGAYLDSVPMSAGQTHIWYGDEEASFSDTMNSPYTPYKVRWLCDTSRPYNYTVPPPKTEKDEKEKEKIPEYSSEYGSWDSVPTGGTVTALGSPNGSKTCVVKKGEKTGRRSGDDRPTGDRRNDGRGAWSNDGGQTWQNDAGPGWNDSERDEFENDGGEDWSND